MYFLIELILIFLISETERERERERERVAEIIGPKEDMASEAISEVLIHKSFFLDLSY